MRILQYTKRVLVLRYGVVWQWATFSFLGAQVFEEGWCTLSSRPTGCIAGEGSAGSHRLLPAPTFRRLIPAGVSGAQHRPFAFLSWGSFR